jgi:hypothetical protein
MKEIMTKYFSHGVHMLVKDGGVFRSSIYSITIKIRHIFGYWENRQIVLHVWKKCFLLYFGLLDLYGYTVLENLWLILIREIWRELKLSVLVRLTPTRKRYL